MQLDRVSDLFPGRRKPEGRDEIGLVRAEAQINLNENIAVELGNEANQQAATRAKDDDQHRANIAAFFRPFFDTRTFQLVYAETLPVTWQPVDTLGWIVAGVTVYPAVATDFSTIMSGVVHVQGFDEVSDIYLPLIANPYHVSMRRKIYGVNQINMTLVGTAGGKTVLSPVLLDFQLESWGNGVPLPSGE